MEYKIIYIPVDDINEIKQNLREKLEETFEANFMLLFFTPEIYENHREVVEIFREYYPDIQMLGCFIEGYAVGEELWTRGIVAVLGKFNGDVRVFYERGDDLNNVCERLGDKVGENWDLMLIMYPWIYSGETLRLVRYITRDKYTRFMYRFSSGERKRKILRKYSEYLEKNLIYPVDKVLINLAESTGKKFPIIGMNLIPLEAKAGTPLILANYEEVRRGIAGICFKGRVNAVYHDVFPERGSSFEETVSILKSYFSDAEEVKVVKEGLAIGEVNGKTAVRFLKDKFEALEEMGDEDFIKKLEEGKLEMASPYMLGFVNKHNYSANFLGIVNSPVSIYPSLMTLDNFYDDCLFLGEVFKEGPKKFAEIANFKKLNGFDLFIIDMNTIPMYSAKTYDILMKIREKSEGLLIFTTPPSAFLKDLYGKKLTEFTSNIYFSTTGTTALIELE